MAARNLSSQATPNFHIGHDLIRALFLLFAVNRFEVVSAVDSKGRTIWIVDAHRDDGRRFIVHADEKLSAFLELQRAIHEFAVNLTLRDSFSG